MRITLLDYVYRTYIAKIKPAPSTLPIPLPPKPFQNINTAHQNRHFDQRTDRTSKRLLAINAINSNHNRNRELEIIARSRKALRAADSVAKPELVAHEDHEGERNGEIDDQRRHDPEDVDDLVHDVLALGSKEHDDGEDKAYERERRYKADEMSLIILFSQKAAERKARDDRGAERDAEKDSDGGSDCVVADVKLRRRA